MTADPAAAGALAACPARDTEPDGGRIPVGGIPAGTWTRASRPAPLRAGRRARCAPVHRNRPGQRAGCRRARRGSEPAMAAAWADQAVGAARGHRCGLPQRSLRRSAAADRARLARSPPGPLRCWCCTISTTAVDAVTEIEIAHRLREFRAGHTTLLLTTSLALLAVTDRVVVLRGGRVAADATHVRT
ncbi:hypothetical protein HBB16_21780 [Pseudonocardia sp. MCCB 268]|nr:hypothetical protein [Pseudonocardia cytotoxica]